MTTTKFYLTARKVMLAGEKFDWTTAELKLATTLNFSLAQLNLISIDFFFQGIIIMYFVTETESIMWYLITKLRHFC